MKCKITVLLFLVGLFMGTLGSAVTWAMVHSYHRYTACEFAMAVGDENLPQIKRCLARGDDPNTDVFSFVSDVGCGNQIWAAQPQARSQMPALIYTLHPKKMHNDIGNTVIAHLLLQAGADPDCADDNGNTPLMVAAASGNVEAVRMLLAKQARPRTVNKDGVTALQMAQSSHQRAIIVLLDTAANTQKP